ncbi:TPA: antirestriction protein [Escherichia coli]|uniref:antirestriction protein n=1 Tax=Escherichia coli TaxID=562 RepID=UPI0010CC61B5|nr:antirestriction protein [Escherichia coli]EJG4520965.1 antirestriction protein [Escherichia coli]GDB35910.1 antirestriction protein [Escherichia coli]HCP1377099.1 antirestriction protein [Escherichia coli]HDS6454822.1 antirestriction protein [Escherichia coli]HEO9324034.1 antirestriction protein [Escherichia coli]
MQYAKTVILNVEEIDRLSFLPYLFGNDFLYAEAYVYALAKKMMPDGDRFHLVNGENWFDRTVSADAAGIILTSLVINRQLWLYHDSGDAGLTHLYRMRDAQLWSHIEFHPECNAIYAALD